MTAKPLNDAFRQHFQGEPDPESLPHGADPETDAAPPTRDEKRVTGKIIKVSSEQGWGFVTSKEIPFTRIFFHWTSLKQDTLKFPQLRKGMRVEFTPQEVADKGYRAIKIRVLDEPEKVTQPTEKKDLIPTQTPESVSETSKDDAPVT